MKHFFALLFLMIATPLWAQLNDSTAPTGPVHGTLYVEVDQTAKIYINGAEVKLSKTKTADVTLGPGDRLVAKIASGHYYRHFGVLFVSDNKATEISFHVSQFKLMPDPDKTDFTADEFNAFPKGVYPIDELMKAKYVAKNGFPVKNDSEFFWGDENMKACTVGALITADMFSPVQS